MLLAKSAPSGEARCAMLGAPVGLREAGASTQEEAMSLQPQAVYLVPEETARVARAAFAKGTPYLSLRDELGLFYTDAQFADLFPTQGQPAEAPWRLALVSVLQFAEGLC